ncbi:MAG: SHOCT domain-containing protein [Acidimicrobiales bacterium]|nr:SHOCT domain-containing protein [Acidimicrobiales bacterium]
MVLASIDFWDVFWLLVIWVPLLMLWIFALVDIFGRQDLPGAGKAVWVLAVLLVPFFGTLVYLLVRPVATTPEEKRAMAGSQEAYDASIMADHLHRLSELHDRGKLTDDEWEQAKSKLLSQQ